MTSRLCPRITSLLPGVWTLFALWRPSGRSAYLKMHRVDRPPSKTDARLARQNPRSTRHRSLARTHPNPALVPQTRSTHAQATQPNTSLPSLLRLHLLILTIRTLIKIPATTAISSLRWTKCRCSSKHTGCHSQSKVCRTLNWPTYSSQLPCRRPTRSATWTLPRSSSGNNSTAVCIRLQCSNIWPTNSSRVISSSNKHR